MQRREPKRSGFFRGLLRSLLVRAASSTLDNPQPWLIEALSAGGSSAAGQTVSVTSSMRVATFWACVKVLSEDRASLPAQVFERLGDNERRVAREHPVYRLIHDKPNQRQTAMEWAEMCQSHLFLYGNSYSYILRDSRDIPIGLYPWSPNGVKAKIATDGTLEYVITVGGGEVTIPGRDVLHVRALSTSGLTGLSVLDQAREVLGLAQAEHEHGARLFSNGAAPGGIFEHPSSFETEEDGRRFLNAWNARHQGSSNAHFVGVLEEGITYKPLGMNSNDAQFLESRKFSVEEIARMFRMPPHKIGHLERSTNNNIEHQGIEYVTNTLRPWLVRWEQAMNDKLLSGDQFFIEHNADALMRGDTVSRIDSESKSIQTGILTINEARALENRNPVEGGDSPFVPVNLVTLSNAQSMGQDEPDAPTERGGQELPQRRDTQSSGPAPRLALRAVYAPLFRQATKTILSLEAAALLDSVERYRSKRDVPSFHIWLERFYDEFQEIVSENYDAVVRTAIRQAAEAASKEVGISRPDLEQFAQDYLNTLTNRYVISSHRQLKALPTLEEIEARVLEWETKRPDKVASRESVQAIEAAAVAVFAFAGTKIVWRTMGDNCPLCDKLAGRTVQALDPFVYEGETIDPLDGVTTPLTARSNHRNPPIHAGCDCYAAPE